MKAKKDILARINKMVKDTVLRQQCKSLSREEIKSKETQKLIDHMLASMRKEEITSMAAPQVGQAKRLFVTAGNGFPPPKDYSTEVNRFLSWMDQHPPKVVINPVIEDASDSTQEAMESYFGKVERPIRIDVSYEDRHGARVSERLEDWNARLFMHELDHLEGVIFTDRLDSHVDLFHSDTMTNATSFARFYKDNYPIIDEAEGGEGGEGGKGGEGGEGGEGQGMMKMSDLVDQGVSHSPQKQQ